MTVLGDRGYSTADLNQAMAVVDDACRALGQDPMTVFGDPVAYAQRLRHPGDTAFAPVTGRPPRTTNPARVHIPSIILVAVMILATMAGGWYAKALADFDSTVSVGAGLPFAFITITVAVLSLMKIPLKFLFASGARVFAFIAAMVVVMVVIVLIAVLWTTPILTMGVGTLGVVAALLTVATMAGFAVQARRVARDEPTLAKFNTQLVGITPLLVIGTSLLVYFG